MLADPFFRGATPDMLSSPVGVSFLIVMSCRLACLPSRFCVGSAFSKSIKQSDEFDAAARDLTCRFESNWSTIGSNMLALDVAILSGIENCRIETEKLESSLAFWYHEGRHLIETAFGQNVEQSSTVAFENAYGSQFSNLPRSDLVEDNVVQAKNNSQSVVRDVLIRSHDSVEEWLRTGLYGDVSLSPPTNEAGMCCSAIATGASTVQVALLHGTSVGHQFGIESFIISDHCFNSCAACEKTVGVLQGIVLNTEWSECKNCSMKMCIACASKKNSMCIRCS